jgi:hypothetical protein
MVPSEFPRNRSGRIPQPHHRFSRILGIYLKIREESCGGTRARGVTVAHLAKMFDCTVRTVYRDITIIQFSGEDVYSKNGKMFLNRKKRKYVPRQHNDAVLHKIHQTLPGEFGENYQHEDSGGVCGVRPELLDTVQTSPSRLQDHEVAC